MTLKQRIGGLRLVPSDGGVFEVSLDDETIHSKKATGEFPDANVVFKAIEKKV